MGKTLLSSDPTHFGVILIGTGLTESILAAALSKAGYAVLHLDQSPIYGDESASLSLRELVALTGATTSTPAPAEAEAASALKKSAHFSISLAPSLLPALGPGIMLLKRSRVAVYLQFGLLQGIGFWARGGAGDAKGKGRETSDEDAGEARSAGQLVKVPLTKADIFNSPTLSLVQKRRVTKLLLFAAENEEGVFEIPDPTTTFRTFLKDKFAIETDVAETVAYALCLCTDVDDLALPTLVRLRTTLRSAGIYGASPFLVGHYGGVGDLIGGFSRICAVWGGGQILGRPIGALVPDALVGLKAEPSNSGGPTATVPGPVPAPSSSSATALGVPVVLDEGEPADLFTADWVISSTSHLATLCPAVAVGADEKPHSVQGVVVLNAPIPFEVGGSAEDRTDSTLFVFPPRALCAAVGSVTAMQVGHSTFACPEGYHVLYLSAPLLASSDAPPEPAAALEPYLTALLALDPATSSSPVLFTSYRYVTSPTTPPAGSLPPNLRLVPSLPCRTSPATTDQLVSAVDQAATLAEALFWEIVGDDGRAEGVKFFAEEEVAQDEEV